MGRDDFLISYFLKVHDLLKIAAQAKFKAKEILTILHCQQVQIQIMHSRINSHSLNQSEVYLYSCGIKNATKVTARTLTSFQQQYLDKLINVSHALDMIQEKLSASTIAEYMPQKLTDKEKNYWLCLVQLRELVRNLAEQYRKQRKLIEQKWKNLFSTIMLGINTQNLETNLDSTKALILHTSFQTEIQSQTMESWDTAITGLQSKRYQI